MKHKSSLFYKIRYKIHRVKGQFMWTHMTSSLHEMTMLAACIRSSHFLQTKSVNAVGLSLNKPWSLTQAMLQATLTLLLMQWATQAMLRTSFLKECMTTPQRGRCSL